MSPIYYTSENNNDNVNNIIINDNNVSSNSTNGDEVTDNVSGEVVLGYLNMAKNKIEWYVLMYFVLHVLALSCVALIGVFDILGGYMLSDNTLFKTWETIVIYYVCGHLLFFAIAAFCYGMVYFLLSRENRRILEQRSLNQQQGYMDI